MKRRERSHVSKDRGPIIVEPRTQVTFPAPKPTGFWFEVNGDWRRWARSEMPDWIEGRHLHRVALGDERMLEIRNAAELDRFYAEFGVSEFITGRWYTGDMDRGIAWERVAESFDGIEIAPYIWARRLDGPSWYYGWDCASGVIWRPRGVQVEWSRLMR